VNDTFNFDVANESDAIAIGEDTNREQTENTENVYLHLDDNTRENNTAYEKINPRQQN
jgi:hypothetical protein